MEKHNLILYSTLLKERLLHDIFCLVYMKHTRVVFIYVMMQTIQYCTDPSLLELNSSNTDSGLNPITYLHLAFSLRDLRNPRGG